MYISFVVYARMHAISVPMTASCVRSVLYVLYDMYVVYQYQVLFAVCLCMCLCCVCMYVLLRFV